MVILHQSFLSLSSDKEGEQEMPYSDKVLEHYNNPRNVGSLPKDDPSVGTGVVGAPACGDVMKLQIKIVEKQVDCTECEGTGTKVEGSSTADGCPEDLIVTNPCPRCNGKGYVVEEIIEDARFKTFGCGSAIASSSLATEWLKGKTAAEAGTIKNKQIVEELSLPPIKIHCSVLAESAIKAALADYHRKKAERAAGVPHGADEAQDKKDV